VSDENDIKPEDIPTPELSEGWEDDFLSEAEALYWPKYDEISEARKANKLAIHRTLGCVIPVAIALAFIGFVALLGVYVAHLIIPAEHRWLTPDELQHIHSMIFSSVVGGAVAVFAKTYFLDSKDDEA
jgi:hypothetical protein